MIVKADNNSFTQKCFCGAENKLSYKNIRVLKNNITLPICGKCKKTIECVMIESTAHTKETLEFIKNAILNK